ncbi:NAD(P)-dependent oxidoreductase [Haloechinothrix sp. LS1_15]|uniref:NAD-dependent epimerase/dehydratase family protein n=1 Tax=Haloechinothrix sp. LS1_15 TaxID=2652248 RepID=UPI00294823EC|nr:NAD(P)-dependent oxidoreductase [Haloechinothrix sp. LS1_15]MDV6012554.1 NAD(P)-dependent oxidoreductase [Haloechinothrix sp. LS1_15]
MAERILITGAAGRIGAMLRQRMPRRGRLLRLLDAVPLDGDSGAAADVDAEGAVEIVRADVTDAAAVERACRDVDAVVHLAALPGEAPWPDVLHANIHGTYTVLEAARRAGVPRVVLASSNHAVGFHPLADGVGDYAFPRPDTFYGVSKVTGEALGSLYHDRYGMHVLCLRIGSATERPRNLRELETWLSPEDCARLVEAMLAAQEPGFRVVWGVSANSRGRFSLREALELGYRPQDDAERYRHLIAGEVRSDEDVVGGPWARRDAGPDTPRDAGDP